jgi:uncharacterized protein YcfL
MGTFKAVIVSAAAALALAGLSACTDSVNSVENADKQAKPQFLDSKRVITDPYLEGRLKILSDNVATNEAGLLQVQVTAVNTRTGFWSWLIQGSMPYRLAYKFVWLDSQGMEVKTAASSVYIETQVLPGDTIRFSGLAPNPDCKDFQLMIKEMENP